MNHKGEVEQVKREKHKNRIFEGSKLLLSQSGG